MLGALVLATTLSACGGDDGEFHGRALDQPYQVPDVDFTDTSGAPFSLAADTTRRLTLTFFGYTRCADICPAVLNHLAAAMTRLDDADRSQVQVVFVSSDPEYDTEARIRAYLDMFDPTFVGVRADLDTTIEVGKAFAVGIDRRDPGGHTTQILGIDKTDEVPVYWSESTTSSAFAGDIHTLLNGS